MNELTNKTIDLSQYYKSNSRIYSGRDFGKEVRKKLYLDKLDKDNISYSFEFPDDIMYVADSFILGLLGNSYINMGEEEFLKKYSFKTVKKDSKYSEYIVSDFKRGLLYIKNYSSRVL